MPLNKETKPNQTKLDSIYISISTKAMQLSRNEMVL